MECILLFSLSHLNLVEHIRVFSYNVPLALFLQIWRLFLHEEANIRIDATLVVMDVGCIVW